MFYSDRTRGYALLAAYRVKRLNVETNRNEAREFSSLAFRVRGQSQFLTHGKTLCADEKSLIYIPKNMEFTHIGGNEELIILHLRCYGEDDREITVLHADGVEELFEKLYREWEAGGEQRYHRCMSLLYGILETVEKAKQAPQALPPTAIEEGVRYLYSHYRDESLTVARLASLCHVSEVYFRRSFHACFGTSPWQCILELRFSYACTLLRSGYYSVKEISEEVGFSNVKYFRTAFGKRFGCTPTEYAREHL